MMAPGKLIKHMNYHYHYDGIVEKVEYVKHTLNHRVFQSGIFIHYLSEITVKKSIHEIPTEDETSMD